MRPHNVEGFLSHLKQQYGVTHDHAYKVVVIICKSKGIDPPEDPRQIGLDRNRSNMEEDFFDYPPLGAAQRDQMRQDSYAEDKDWPYDDDPKTIATMTGKATDASSSRQGIPQYKDDKDADNGKVWKAELEASGIGGASTSHIGQDFYSSKNRAERRKRFASNGEPFSDEATGDFEKEMDNYNDENDDMKNKNSNASTTSSTKVMESVIGEAFRAYAIESIKKKILGEKISQGVYGKIQKSGANINPWVVAWKMKNEGKLPKSEKELKEFAENYMKEMGYSQCASKESCDIWRKKKSKTMKEGSAIQTIRDAWGTVKSFQDAYFPQSEQDLTPEMKKAMNGATNKAKLKHKSTQALQAPKNMDANMQSKYKKAEPWIRLGCLAVTAQLPSVGVDDVKPFADQLILNGKVDLDSGKDIVTQIAVTSLKTIMNPTGSAMDQAKKDAGQAGADITDMAMKKGLEAELKKDNTDNA